MSEETKASGEKGRGQELTGRSQTSDRISKTQSHVGLTRQNIAPGEGGVRGRGEEGEIVSAQQSTTSSKDKAQNTYNGLASFT